MIFGKKVKAESDNTVYGEVAIESSICTGEKIIGFKDEKTGKLEQAVVVNSQKDIDDFYKKYGLPKPKN